MQSTNKVITLDKIKKGEEFLITRFENKQLKCLSTRLGICEGQTFKCFYRCFGGPIILKKKFQEIAIGKKLAKSVQVKVV